MENLSNFVLDQVEEANKDLLPQKSKLTYEEVWLKYIQFCCEKKIQNEEDINSVYAYLNWMHTEKKWKSPATIWNKYSILKAMVFNKKGINFENNPVEKQIFHWIKKKKQHLKRKRLKCSQKSKYFSLLKMPNYLLFN